MNNTQNKNKTIELKQYSIKIEALVPITVTYVVTAENPEQALSKINSSLPPREVSRPLIERMRKIQARVYRAGTIMLELVKKY